MNLASLLNFVQQQMDKNAGPRCYGSSLDHAGEIIVLPRSRAASQKEPLERVREGLNAEEGPSYLLDPCRMLSKVLKITPNLKEACQLRKEFEAKIDSYKNTWRGTLRDNWGKLIELKANPRILIERKKLIANFSFESLSVIDGPSLSDVDELDQVRRGGMTLEAYCESLRAIMPKESVLHSVNRPPLVQGTALGSGNTP